MLFSASPYDGSQWAQPDGSMSLGHVTNYAQNMDGLVWDLDMLRDHMGQEGFAKVWSQIEESVAHTFSSTLGEMQAQHAALGLSKTSTFEVSDVCQAVKLVYESYSGLVSEFHPTSVEGSVVTRP